MLRVRESPGDVSASVQREFMGAAYPQLATPARRHWAIWILCVLRIPVMRFAALAQRHLYFLFALQLFCGLGAGIFHAQAHFPT